MLTSYSVIAADTLRDLVTLIFDLLILVTGHTWRVKWSTPAQSTKFEDSTAIRSWVMSSDISHRIPLTMRLQPLRMRRITWPMCRGNFSRIFEIHDPDLHIHYTTFMALRLRQKLSAKTMYGPVLKITQLSAHAQNHVSLEQRRKCFTTIVLGDHDFPLTASNLGNLTAFRAIFGHIHCACAETAIYELPVKTLTSPFDSLTLIAL